VQFVVVFVAPVPVGHSVEITWYEHVQEGLVPSQSRVDSRPAEPVIRDLDTGITYMTEWAVGSQRRKSPDAAYELGDDLLADYQEAKQVTGKVLWCQVVTIRGYPQVDVQTHLLIEIDGE
jgi:hypothetical protein